VPVHLPAALRVPRPDGAVRFDHQPGRLRTLTDIKNKYTQEQTIDDLIAIKRASRAEAEHGDGAVVRNQS
jgi:hypothetical protein